MFIPGDIHIEVDWSRDGTFGDERAGNLLTNGNFETDDSGWTTTGGTTLSVTSDSEHVRYGNASLKVVATGVGTPNTLQDAALAGATAGLQRTFSVSVYVSAAMVGKTFRLEISETGGASAQATTQANTVPTSAGWHRLSVSRTVVANDRTAIRVRMQGPSWIASDTAWWDGARLEAGLTATAWDDGLEDITSLMLGATYMTGRDDASYLTGKAGPGRLQVSLDNTDSRFSPFNGDSPLFGMLNAGALVRVRDDGKVKWIGRMLTPKPSVAGRIKTATLEAEGILAELAKHRITPLVSGSGDRTGTLMIEALNEAAAGFDTSGIEEGDVITGPFGQEDPETDLLDELRRLEEIEFGFLFEDPSTYRVNFHSRTHRAGMTTSLATFADSPTEALHFDHVDQDATKIYNRAVAGVSPFTLLPEQVLMTIPGPIVLGIGGTQTLQATYDGPVVSWGGHTRRVSIAVDPPAPADVTITNFPVDTPNHAVQMPATVNAGDLLVIIYVARWSDRVGTVSGFTRIYQGIGAPDSALGDQYPRIWVGAKIATGSEDGTTVNVPTSGGTFQQGEAHVYRFSDYNTAGALNNGTIIQFAPIAVGDSDTESDPPELTPTWGAVPSCFIAIGATGSGTGVSLVETPADYTVEAITPNTSPSMATAYRSGTFLSQNPGPFEWSNPSDTSAVTIAVRGRSTGETDVAEPTPDGRDGSFTIAYDPAVGGLQQLHENIEVYGVALAVGDILTAQADYAPTQDPLTGVGISSYRNAADLFRNLSEADSYAELVVLHFGEARPIFKGHFIANASEEFYEEFREREVGDRITITADALGASGLGIGVDEAFVVEAIEVQIGPLIGVAYHCSPAFLTDPFILDSSTLDSPQLLT